MFQPVHRKAAAIAFQQLQVREHAVRQILVEGEGRAGDFRPVVLRPFRHGVKSRPVYRVLGHGPLSIARHSSFRPPSPQVKCNCDTSLCTSLAYGMKAGMEEMRKITVEVPSDLLDRAQAFTGEGVTETVRTGLKKIDAE